MTSSTVARAQAARAVPARLATARDVAVLAGSIGLIALLIKAAWPRFTFWGDNAESFFPLWHMYGTSIRDGSPALFQANGWAGGNVIGEAAYGVLNPVVIVNAVLISLTDRLSLASFIVMTEFLCLFGVGVYFLARSYGARRSAALVAGIIMPFAGYTVYYEAGNWASGLMSVTWVTWFWWAAHEMTEGRRGPAAAIASGMLAATVGSPYAVLGLLMVLAGLSLEAAFRRCWTPLLWLVLSGAAVGAAVVAVYIPLLAALPDTVRVASGSLGNENYLTPGLGDLLGLSSPTYAPRMNAWLTRWDAVPSTYLGWAVLPLLPWMRWKVALRSPAPVSIFLVGGGFLLLCLGPQNVWLFQWPIRFVEYLYVAVVVLFAVILSAGFARDRLRSRWILSAGAVALSFYVAFSSKPEWWGWHGLVAGISAAAVASAVLLTRRFAMRAVAAVIIAGTAVIAPVQTQLFAWDRQAVTEELDQEVPSDLSLLRHQGDFISGTVLQLAWLRAVSATAAVPTGELSFGNSRAAAGFDTVNRYTGIGFEDFALATGMDYRGSTPSPMAVERVFQPLVGYDVSLVQAMGVDTLVVSPLVPDFDELGRLAQGWTVRSASPQRTILGAPWDETFRVTPRPGLVIAGAEENGASVEIDVAGGGGAMLLPRVAWRGYSAMADGQPVPVRAGPAGLLEVDVPVGTSHVAVRYEIPGIRLSAILAVSLVVGAVAMQMTWVRRAPRGCAERESAGGRW